MGKKDKAAKADKLARKIAKLEAIVADKSNPKHERKAAKALIVDLRAGTVLDSKFAEIVEAYAKTAKTDAPLGEVSFTPDEINAAADRVLDDANASDGAKEKARAAKLRAAKAMKDGAAEPEVEAAPAVDDAALAARVHAKRTLRKAGLLVEGDSGEATVDPDSVPRDRPELVDAYNVLIGARGGHYITSDDERAAIADRLGGAVGPEAKADKPRKPKADEIVVTVDGEALAAPAEPVTIAEHEVVEVETERGREFAVGEAVAVTPAPDLDFVSPSDAPPVLETNGLGRYKIKRPSDGKLVGYTRVTTYIDNLEDKSALTKWKLRILLEGLAINEVEVGTRAEGDTLPPHLLAELRDAVHAREVAVAKAHKASRKGKLKAGELGEIIDAALSEYKRTADRIAEAALELGGVKDAARKGTDLHALCELHDLEGIDAVSAKLEAGEITPADFDDVLAYARALEAAGVKIIREHVEQVVVNDELKVAGRLDRVALYRFPGTQRAVRCVLDIKSGRLDFGTGKIAQQLELYACAQGYDLATHERIDLKLSRTKALVMHLPAGKATATLHEVDLVAGRRGNKLSGEVRSWRNEGRKAILLTTDLADPVAAEALAEARRAEAEKSAQS